MTSTSSRFDSSIFTYYVNVPLSIDKLDDTSYETWAFDIKLGLRDKILLIISPRQQPQLIQKIILDGPKLMSKSVVFLSQLFILPPRV